MYIPNLEQWCKVADVILPKVKAVFCGPIPVFYSRHLPADFLILRFMRILLAVLHPALSGHMLSNTQQGSALTRPIDSSNSLRFQVSSSACVNMYEKWGGALFFRIYFLRVCLLYALCLKRTPDSLDLEWHLCATMVLEIKPVSCGRIASALNVKPFFQPQRK